MTFAYLVIIGICLGKALAMVPSLKAQRAILAVLIAGVLIGAGPELWSSSAYWRVHTVPALSSQAERKSVADADEIRMLVAQIQRRYATNKAE